MTPTFSPRHPITPTFLWNMAIAVRQAKPVCSGFRLTLKEPKVLVKLPPHSYALYLIGQFESFMGFDYHWYQKKRFRARINALYDPSQSQAIERTWLCCFSVVLALGDSYNDSVAPSFLIDNRTGFSTDDSGTTNLEQLPPRGIEFFKQGLLLLRPSYEEPTIEQVEALNLIVSMLLR